jgi:hypothetical protein
VPGDDPEEQIKNDYKDSLVQGLAPPVIAAWIEKIVNAANKLCGGSAIRYEKTGYIGEIVAPTRKDAECLAKAIDMHAPAAPELVRNILVAYRARLLA